MVREPVHFHHKPGLVIDSALGCDLIELYTHFFKKQVLLHIFFLYIDTMYFSKFRIHEKRRLYTVYSIYREYKELVFGQMEMDVLCFLIENIYVILKQEENGKKIKD